MSNVIQFIPKPKPPRKRITGVFIIPCYSPLAVFMLENNLCGYLNSFIAFHPDFNPNIIRKDIQ